VVAVVEQERWRGHSLSLSLSRISGHEPGFIA
jgi:hypothetical protein